MVAIRVAHHQVHRAHGGGKLAAHQLPALTKNLGHLLRKKLLQVRLHTVLDEARVDAQVLGHVRDNLVDTNDELVIGLIGLNRPDLLDAFFVVAGLAHGDRTRRRHPVQRLV